MQETRLKELFDSIPTLDELHALGGEGYKADIILVDSVKDKKLSMLKQLLVTLVKGLNSNPAAIIKKIAGLVCIYYIFYILMCSSCCIRGCPNICLLPCCHCQISLFFFTIQECIL